MIIDTSYFLNKAVYIPAAVTQPSIGSATPTTANMLTQEIDQREYEVLLSSLGYEQTAELLDQFETNGNWKPSALQKWKDLVDGLVYGGKKWNGLRYSIGTKKISLIAFYTFFYYLKQDYSTYTTTGIQVPEAENSTRQSPNAKQAEAWNTFVQMYGGNRFDIRDYSFFHNWNGLAMVWGGNNNKNVVTYCQFLTDKNDVYDTSFFSIPNGGIKGSLINPLNL